MNCEQTLGEITQQAYLWGWILLKLADIAPALVGLHQRGGLGAGVIDLRPMLTAFFQQLFRPFFRLEFSLVRHFGKGYAVGRCRLGIPIDFFHAQAADAEKRPACAGTALGAAFFGELIGADFDFALAIGQRQVFAAAAFVEAFLIEHKHLRQHILIDAFTVEILLGNQNLRRAQAHID